jgi:hypothetical protein
MECTITLGQAGSVAPDLGAGLTGAVRYCNGAKPFCSEHPFCLSHPKEPATAPYFTFYIPADDTPKCLECAAAST